MAIEEVQETTPSPTSAAAIADDDDLSNKSALQDNIERKGKNAYYFAHAHKATGPKWDGKIEPKLLSRESSSALSVGGNNGNGNGNNNKSGSSSKVVASFEYHKSNITNYAFLDEGDETKKIKIYVNLPGVGSCCPKEEDVELEFTERSLCLKVNNYYSAAAAPADATVTATATDGDELVQEVVEEKKGEDRCLSFGRLFGEIDTATFRKKPDKIIITLKKKESKQWTKLVA